MSTVYQYLIICPLVFIAGFIDAVAGGGGLISLPAYLICGLPVHFAIGTNKLSAGMGTAMATIRYAKNGFIDLKKSVLCIVCALVGASIGAKLALSIADHYFKIVMLVLLPLTAVYVFLSHGINEEKEPFSSTKTALIAMGAALVIGIYDGFYGPGTGTFLILLLTGLARLKLTQANGLTKMINLTTNITTLTVYLLNGKVLLPLGLTAGLFGIAGNYLGAGLFGKRGSKLIKPFMIVVLIIFFVKVLLEVISE